MQAGDNDDGTLDLQAVAPPPIPQGGGSPPQPQRWTRVAASEFTAE